MIRSAVFLLAPLLCLGADYSLGPDSQAQEGVPKGKVTQHMLAPGKYFPGTPHKYSIYVSAQYDPAKPAAFMIFLDGSGALGNGVRVPVVFDNLIHKRQLPPMIGIFVDPGMLPAATEKAQSRFERVFEYDSLSDRYSRFLVEELIPEVGKSYNLSKDPNDRGLYGVSTGAVGAMVAAWHRPDQFRRVLSFIGTFVAMKGGDGFAALIRRSEAKPIRVFLQAGKNDHVVPNQPQGTFYAGSWPVNNQVMLDALLFAGYDAKLELGEEGHNMKHGAAILPDALRWLWRGYPEPITVREPAALNGPGWDTRGKVSSVVAAGTPWEKVKDGATGPVAGLNGVVYFAAPGGIYKVENGAAALFQKTAGAVTALAVGGDGRVYAAEAGRIVSYGPSGEKTLAKMTATALAATTKGDIFYVDGAKKRAGKVGGGSVELDMMTPSGIALSPDEAMLVVTDAGGRFAWSYQIGAGGALQNGEPFFRLELPETGWTSGVRGAALDSIGQVYFATALGVQMCEANGRVAAILHSPEGRVNGLAFGGSNLYLTTEGGLYRRAVKVQGGVLGALPRPPL
ncbi:MAG TPA: alpha/beta hydrolase-fold protein [Bryobacteraceae bacterium]|nr:alpha/beta hydrolase-fold protein [Bryobacteraceae bacterium]